MSVADFGSGSGAYSIALAEIVGESGKVYAVEIQKDLLTRLQAEAEQKNITNIEFVWGDIDDVDGSNMRDNSVDRLVVANTLFQVEDRDNCIAEARRVLRPGGKLLLVDWVESFGGLGPTPDLVISPDVARTMFDDAQFEFDRDIIVGDHHYGMVFKLK